MKWIKVKEKLPEEDSVVLVWHKTRPNSFVVAVYEASRRVFLKQPYFNETQFPIAPTHWTRVVSPIVDKNYEGGS